MFKRLTVRNFRTLGDVTLDLAPYTVIVGQNRAGKSNTLRAMRALFTNATGDDFIRQGQTSCSVELETEEGYVVLWEKTKAGASYTIKKQGEEDRVFTKLAGQVPPEVQAVIGIRNVEVDATTNIWPQVHQQGEYAFLIKPHLTSGQAARAIARLTKLDVVVKAQTLCKSTIRELNSRIKELKSAVARSSEEYEEFQHLEQDKEFLEDASKSVKYVGIDVTRHGAGYAALVQYDAAGDAAVLFIPHPDDLAALDESIETLEAVRLLIDIIDQPTPLLAIPDTEAVRNELELLGKATGYWEKYSATNEELAILQAAADESLVQQRQVLEELEDLKGQECPVCGGSL